MKKCPFCAEEIQDEAVKCRFCGEFLDQERGPAPSKASIPFYFRMGTIITGFLFVGPLVLPLVLFNPHLKTKTKVIASLIMLLVTLVLYKLMVFSLDYLNQYFKLLQGQYQG